MLQVLERSALARHAAAATAGVALALVVSRAWNLEPRYIAAFIAAVFLTAAALGLVKHLKHLLLYVLAFNLPFTSIEKSFLLTQEPTFVASGVTVGLTDLALAALYVIWFVNVVVLRRDSLPRVTFLDKAVFLFWGVHVVSAIASISPTLTLYEVVRLGKYVLAYFYLAHNLRRFDIKWLVAGVMFTLLLQTSVAIVQQRTGKLMGIGRTKGSSEVQYEQYTVTGFEAVRRAEGTTFDSHALGLMMAMGLMIPAAIALSKGIDGRARWVASAVLAVGSLGLVLSFARAAWVAFAAGLLVVLFHACRTASWRSIVMTGTMASVAGAALVLPFAPLVRQRLFEAPPELLSARVETVQMGLEMWRANPWTGLGANTYMLGLQQKFSIFEGDPYFIPAHNMMANMLTELGVVGVAAFVILSIAVVVANYRLMKSTDPLTAAMGAALLGAFAAFHAEGITDPIYVTTVTYFFLWFQLGLTGGLYRLSLAARVAPERDAIAAVRPSPAHATRSPLIV